MCSGQRRSAGSAQVSGEQVPEMDGSMALMAMEEGAGTGEVVALAGARVMVHVQYKSIKSEISVIHRAKARAVAQLCMARTPHA